MKIDDIEELAELFGIIADDETWYYDQNPDTKQQSSQ